MHAAEHKRFGFWVILGRLSEHERIPDKVCIPDDLVPLIEMSQNFQSRAGLFFGRNNSRVKFFLGRLGVGGRDGALLWGGGRCGVVSGGTRPIAQLSVDLAGARGEVTAAGGVAIGGLRKTLGV